MSSSAGGRLAWRVGNRVVLAVTCSTPGCGVLVQGWRGGLARYPRRSREKSYVDRRCESCRVASKRRRGTTAA